MNIRDAESAYLSGKLVFDEWLAEFEAEWFRPVALMQIAMMFKQLPPEGLAAMDPRVLEQLRMMFGEERGG